MTEEVIIEFKVQDDQVDTTLDKLQKAGLDPKVAAQFTSLFSKIKSGQGDVKGLVAEFGKVMQTAKALGKSVEDAFGAGMKDALDEAGVSMEEFQAALQEANQPVKSLKTELKDLKYELAQAKLNGTDTGEAFNKMRQRAGELQDAIADAGAEIKNAGSDTRNIDNVVGSISALAGGFSAVQGAAALFGNESEDVQKALLKVNGAMALASGIQQFYNATLKEGSLTKLADSMATGIQTATQKLYTLVTGQATAATIGFKVALAATGIGLVIVAVLALVAAMDDTALSVEEVNKQIENQNNLMDMNSKSIDKRTELAVANAKAAGAAESKLIEIRGQGMSKQFDNIQRMNKDLEDQRDAAKNGTAQWGVLNNQIEVNNESLNDLNHQLKVLGIEYKSALKDEGEDRLKKMEENNKKQQELNKKDLADKKATMLQGLNDIVANLERQLLFVEKNSVEELNLKKKLSIAKRNVDLQGEKLTVAQIKLIRAKSYDERMKLDADFNKKASDAQLQAIIDTNNAVLQGIELNNEERLQLQIENINAISQQEITAAEGNAAKILLIQAKSIADIRTLKNAAIDKQLADDVASGAKTNNIVKIGLDKISKDTKESLAVRIAAVKSLAAQETIGVDNAIKANLEKEQSDQDYRDNYKKLAEEKAQIETDVMFKISEINKSDQHERNERLKAIAALTIEIVGQVADFAAQLSAASSEAELQRIDLQKKQLQDLVDAGAITEKQAQSRAKEIEILEAKAKNRQAQQEKSAAIFKAILAIPSAYLQGLSQGGPILGGIYAAIAAAQAAIIISKPVPKFFKGKKDRYEGPGIVGDMGSELVERDGRMFLYTKPTQTYLNAKDKVYTASETRQMLHNTDLKPLANGSKAEKFDYEKLAKAIPQSSFSVNIDKDFIEESVANGISKTKYFTNRYTFE
jgi:hypothetical protein